MQLAWRTRAKNRSQLLERHVRRGQQELNHWKQQQHRESPVIITHPTQTIPLPVQSVAFQGIYRPRLLQSAEAHERPPQGQKGDVDIRLFRTWRRISA